MPKIALQLKAQMEKLTNLKVDNLDDFRWYMKLKCGNCGDETSKFVYFTAEDQAALKGGRGHANLVLKCSLCSRENSIDIIKESVAPYRADDSGNYKTIAVFDCRGLTPTQFDPTIGWAAEGEESSTSFEVDFKEGDWYEYDEKAGESVSITEVSFQFVSATH